jgi:pyruvate/2-oxoglutarate dehydrogenase complex dihydrolipoamide acyltransferase (E2) component
VPQVSTDLRAEQAGVVTHLHKSGDTVRVGQPLYELDPQGVAGAAAAPAPAPTPAPAPAPSPSAGHAADAGGHGHAHKVSIAFRYGKRDPVVAPSHAATAGLAGAAAAGAGGAPRVAPAGGPVAGLPWASASEYAAWVAQAYPSKAGGRSFLDLPPQHGRPRMTPAEMTAIESGGAW